MAKTLMIIQGKALWAKVFEPDTKFNPDGDFGITVVVPENEAAETADILNKMIADHFAEEVKRNPKLTNTLTKKPVYEPSFDRDGNETGDVEFRFKLKAKIQTKDGSVYVQQPMVVDAKRTPMNGDVLIGNGSVVKVAFEPFTYAMPATKQCGVSLRLKGVQVIELVQYASDANMFEEEEGYVETAVARDDRAENMFAEEAGSEVEGDF